MNGVGQGSCMHWPTCAHRTSTRMLRRPSAGFTNRIRPLPSLSYAGHCHTSLRDPESRVPSDEVDATPIPGKDPRRIGMTLVMATARLEVQDRTLIRDDTPPWVGGIVRVRPAGSEWYPDLLNCSSAWMTG